MLKRVSHRWAVAIPNWRNNQRVDPVRLDPRWLPTGVERVSEIPNFVMRVRAVLPPD